MEISRFRRLLHKLQTILLPLLSWPSPHSILIPPLSPSSTTIALVIATAVLSHPPPFIRFYFNAFIGKVITGQEKIAPNLWHNLSRAGFTYIYICIYIVPVVNRVHISWVFCVYRVLSGRLMHLLMHCATKILFLFLVDLLSEIKKG